MMDDKVFTKPIKKQFEFDEEVAAVFDDMLARSVPFYEESQKITEFFVQKHLSENGLVYDLGCSTATLLINIRKKINSQAKLIGLDTSEAMLERARKKSEAFGANIVLLNGDILTYEYKQADVFISSDAVEHPRSYKTPPSFNCFCTKNCVISCDSL